MATLTVWKFSFPESADEAVDRLRSLQKEQLIEVHDAATISWEWGAKRPKTRQLHNLAGSGAVGGMFWGMLFGLIFLVPLLGAAVGAAAGAAAGSLADFGIDDDFVKKVRDQVTPGTSALFVMTSGAVMDKVHDAFRGEHAELIHTNLSEDDEKTLREVFV
jgi:uncharacterized membrane protein